MGVKLSIYNLDDISDSILLDILHKSVLDLQELCASHQAISIAHGRPVLYRTQFQSLFSFKQSDILFLKFDSDKDGKVDFFEVMSVLILCSRVSPLAKIRMVFQLFDLGGKDMLNKSEMTLLVLCLLKGLSKVCTVPLPKEEDVELAVKGAFRKIWQQDMSKLLSDLDVENNPEYVQQITMHPNIKHNGPHVGFSLFSAWIRSRSDICQLFQTFSLSATTQVQNERLKEKVYKYNKLNPDAYKKADSRRNPVASKFGGKFLNKAGKGHKKVKTFKRSDAIILWQVFHSFRKDKRGRVNCLAFKDELLSHGFNEYVKVLFQHISETDLYDTFFSFIDLLQKMHPESPHEELTTMAHDASHHHASTDPGFDRVFIDSDQRKEINELLSLYDEEAHGVMTVTEIIAIICANGYFQNDKLTTMFEEEGLPPDEYLSKMECKNIFAKNFRITQQNVPGDEDGSDSGSDFDDDGGTTETGSYVTSRS